MGEKLGYSGINLENVKIRNRSSILKLLNDQGAMSRKDIAAQLGLTPATVTLICTELLSAGILCEQGELAEQGKAGRKKILIGLNDSYKYVLTISIEQMETCIAACNLKGVVAGSRRLKTDTAKPPREFLKEVAYESKSLLWECGIMKESVLGAGVSIPGPVKRQCGISQHAYRIWDEAVPVSQYLKQYLDFPVIVENNVKAYAEGELIFGTGRRTENLLLVKWGPGVGSAIIIKNQIYDSQNSKTAEIGHYIVEKDGKQCQCGRRGCLETRVSTHALADRVRSGCTPESMPELWRLTGGDLDQIQARTLPQWIGARDPGMWKHIDQVIDELARIVVNTITLLAPDKVITYGQLFELPHFFEHFLKYCKYYDASYNEDYILKSEISSRIGYIGPLAVVVNELFLMAGVAEEL